MQLTSNAFHDGSPIPRRFTGDEDNISPPLSWTAPPKGTKSLALVCEDPDAPGGIWHHWAIFDIPADRRSLPESVQRGANVDGVHQAQNDFHRTGYDGPYPPRGHDPHHYQFRLIALSVDKLALEGQPSCAAVASAAASHTLTVAELTGTYAR